MNAENGSISPDKSTASHVRNSGMASDITLITQVANNHDQKPLGETMAGSASTSKGKSSPTIPYQTLAHQRPLMPKTNDLIRPELTRYLSQFQTALAAVIAKRAIQNLATKGKGPAKEAAKKALSKLSTAPTGPVSSEVDPQTLPSPVSSNSELSDMSSSSDSKGGGIVSGSTVSDTQFASYLFSPVSPSKSRQSSQPRTKNREWKCPEESCGKVFSQLAHLKAHERKHTGERPFQCTYDGCGKRFAQVGNLKIHERCHTGEKPYVCPFPGCGKGFSQKGNMKTHTKIHDSTQKRCPSTGCKKFFTNDEDMQAHIAEKHPLRQSRKASTISHEEEFIPTLPDESVVSDEPQLQEQQAESSLTGTRNEVQSNSRKKRARPAQGIRFKQALNTQEADDMDAMYPTKRARNSPIEKVSVQNEAVSFPVEMPQLDEEMMEYAEEIEILARMKHVIQRS